MRNMTGENSATVLEAPEKKVRFLNCPRRQLFSGAAFVKYVYNTHMCISQISNLARFTKKLFTSVSGTIMSEAPRIKHAS